MAELHVSQQKLAIDYFRKWEIPIDEGMDNLKGMLDKKLLIKIGGNCLNNIGYDSVGEILADLYGLGVIPTIVHGGGYQIDKKMEERGMPIVKVNGLRAVPDEPTLDAVVEELKEVNEGLVSAINKYADSEIAVGLMEEKIIHAEEYPPVVEKETAIDLGLVGNVVGIDADKIDFYLKKEKIPVLWCIGYGKNGQRYNVNADMVGEALAPGYSRYILLTSSGGYLENGKIVAEMSLEETKKYKAESGMLVKLDSVIRVLENTGLSSVQIALPDNLPFELFGKGKGTVITK
jgi:acetylglutamate kinase